MNDMKLFCSTLLTLFLILNPGSADAGVLDGLMKQYRQRREYHFSIGADDIVKGEKGIAIHQIVLITKDDCSTCDDVAGKISRIVRENYMAVYLIIKKNYDITGKTRGDLKISQFPAIFINGRYSPSWDEPGFLELFTNDCGC